MRIFLTILTSLLLMSCSNDDDSVQSQEQDTETVNNFFNLQVGNSWTYEYFKREQFNDDSSPFVSTGTVEEREIIARDIVNNEAIYTVQVTTEFGADDFLSEFDEENATYRVKDSLGYLVRLDVGIDFSSESDDEYLIASENFGNIYGVLSSDTENLEVIGETHECIVNEIFAVNPDGDIFPGRIAILVADQIGVVLERMSLVNNPVTVVERRLINVDFPE